MLDKLKNKFKNHGCAFSGRADFKILVTKNKNTIGNPTNFG